VVQIRWPDQVWTPDQPNVLSSWADLAHCRGGVAVWVGIDENPFARRS
jgi:hypothetical protein